MEYSKNFKLCVEYYEGLLCLKWYQPLCRRKSKCVKNPGFEIQRNNSKLLEQRFTRAQAQNCDLKTKFTALPRKCDWNNRFKFYKDVWLQIERAQSPDLVEQSGASLSTTPSGAQPFRTTLYTSVSTWTCSIGDFGINTIFADLAVRAVDWKYWT